MNLPHAICICYVLFLVHQFLCSFPFSRTSEVSMENQSSAMLFQVNADPNTAVVVILLQYEFDVLCIKIVDHEENS